MFQGLTLVTPPSFNPVSVADARAHSRILFSADDSLVASYITSATKQCEFICKRAFMPQSWRYALEHFPGRSPVNALRQFSNLAQSERWKYIQIPLPPLISITSFNYTDTGGNVFSMQQGFDTTAGNYILDLEPEPGVVRLPYAGIWPVTILLPGSPIKITYVCGYPAYTGVLSLDSLGNATATTGTFDPMLAGTWLTTYSQQTGYVSFNVAAYVDPTHVALTPPTAANPLIPVTGAKFYANAVPMTIRHAILYLTSHFYENREPVVTGRSQTAIEVPQTVDDLLAPYRITFGVYAGGIGGSI